MTQRKRELLSANSLILITVTVSVADALALRASNRTTGDCPVQRGARRHSATSLRHCTQDIWNQHLHFPDSYIKPSTVF